MYAIASHSRGISLVSGCFDFRLATKKEAGLRVQVETNFPDPTIYLSASSRQSATKVTLHLHNICAKRFLCK